MDAELAYLFRHALLRAAAYELQLPGERAVLHALAFEIIELAVRADERLADLAAPDLADHARMAAAIGADWHSREIAWLRRAATVAQNTFRLEDCMRHWAAVRDHPAGDAALRAEAEFEYAKALTFAGRTRECVTRLRAILPALAADSAHRRMEALLHLSQALISVGELDDVPALVREGIEFAHAANRPDVALKLEYVGLRCDRLAGRWEAALSAVERLIAGSAALDDVKQVISLQFFRGALLGDLQRYEEALEAARASGRAAREAGITTLYSFSRGSEGMALRDLGKSAEGLPLMLEAAAGFREAGDRRLESAFMGAAAAAYTNLGKYAESVRVASAAADVARESGNIREEHVALATEALAHLHLRAFDESLAKFAVARGLAAKMGDRYQDARHASRQCVAMLACGDRAGFEATRGAALATLRTIGKAAVEAEAEIGGLCTKLQLIP